MHDFGDPTHPDRIEIPAVYLDAMTEPVDEPDPAIVEKDPPPTSAFITMTTIAHQLGFDGAGASNLPRPLRRGLGQALVRNNASELQLTVTAPTKADSIEVLAQLLDLVQTYGSRSLRTALAGPCDDCHRLFGHDPEVEH